LSFNKKSIIRFLSHPLFLLVIGAIISSIIIPVYTNQWQNYQKELEIKSKLAEEISTSISNKIINSRLVQIAGYTDNIDYAQSTIDWEVSNARISSLIGSYFVDLSFKKQWDGLSFLVTEFSLLETSLSNNETKYDHKLCLRFEHIVNIYKYFLNVNETFAQSNPLNLNFTNQSPCPNRQDQLYLSEHYNTIPGTIDWNILFHKELTHVPDYQVKYRDNWLLLEKTIQQHKNEFIQLLLKAHLLGF
jgi:hypothetical protein